MSIKINNQDIVAINKGEQSIAYVYKGIDLVWQLNADPLDKSIYFADPEVGRVLHAKGLIANAIKSSKRELATITSLNPSSTEYGSYFFNNKVITKFPELQYCTGLSHLRSAFRGCSNLTEVIIPEGVTNLSNTFYDCTSLITAPTIPEGVTSLSNTFMGCSSLLEAPVIPEGVTNMGGTFQNCYKLVNAPIIPEGVTRLGSTFVNCHNLVSAPTIPNGVTEMRSTFVQCYKLVNAPIIPELVTDMTQAFYGSTGLDGIFIIKPVTPPQCYETFTFVNVVAIYVPDESVNRYKTASRWSEFADKIYPMNEPPIEGWDGIFADPEVGRVLHANGLIADANKSSIEELATITSLNPTNGYNRSYFYDNKVITQFPELQYCTGLTSLYYAFSGCSNLTTVGDIPEGVTNMQATFLGCSKLTQAPVIPSSVTALRNTFFNCSSLATAPDIPSSVTDLFETFQNCTSLTKAPVIPSSVTSLRGTFYGCSSIDGIYIINIVTPPYYSNNLSNVQIIYVPDESVDAYKTASGWSQFVDKIYPVSTKP